MRLILAAVFFFAAAVRASDNPTGNEQPVPSAGGEHDFGSKVLIISAKQQSQPSGYLAKAKVRKLGDRFFLVGQGQKAFGGRVVIWVPLSEITSITEFDNPEAAQREIDNLREEKKKSD